jgi:L,D-transpeptidase YcbB
MIGILLFWLAFSPVRPVLVKPAATQQEQLQPKKELGLGTTEKIHERLDRLIQQKSPEGSSERALFNIRLHRFYAARGFQPVWAKRTMIAELISAVEESVDDGLEPTDYHLKEIKDIYSKKPATPELSACYDILLTEVFLTFSGNLRYGKVDPETLDTHWNVGHARNGSVLEYKLHNASASGQIAAVLKDLRLQHPKYDMLKKGLARYRTIEREGGWPVLAEGVKLKEGVRENRVTMLRQRLKVSGDISALNSDTTTVYSREMVDAVRRFQKRNGIEVDGVVGAATIRVMNIPVARRIDEIRINLERCRWFLSDLEPTCIMVNVPSFTLQYVEKGRQRWSTRVIVGKPQRETPLFKADMQYVILNPQWVIPPTILDKDALPALRKSVSYLSRKNLKIIARDGGVIAPSSVNWSQYSAANFPYRLQQGSGDDGALGRIKFLLPNRYIVYLHDTPSKELFAENTRTFSSGCIRVQNPLDLAALVLQDSVLWSKTKINAAINTGKTKMVTLPKRIPVYILYLTATDEGDELQFRQDVYNRDEKLLKALNKPLPQYKTESCGL